MGVRIVCHFPPCTNCCLCADISLDLEKCVVKWQVERLKCQFRCLGVDLRGNGGDTPSGTGPNVVHFADDIRRVIQALDLKGVLAGDMPQPENPSDASLWSSCNHELLCLRVRMPASFVPGCINSAIQHKRL